MSIAQRKDGRYCVKYKYNGKWQQRAFKTEEEARQFEAEAHNIKAADEPLSVGEIMVAYLRNVPHHKQTVDNYKSVYFKENGDGFFLFDRFPETLTRRDLERLRENMRARNLSPHSINSRVSMVKAALSWGIEQELVSSNPWKDYKRLPVKQKPISVSMDKFRAIYALAPNWLQWSMKTAFCLCLRTGLTELFGLKWSAFNFCTSSVTITQGKTGLLKTVMPPAAYMDEAKQRYKADTERGIEYVCTKKGRPIKAEYQYHWKNACNRAGVKMRMYDIRHLAATTMLANGADIVSVAAQLGHTDCSMTGKVYAHALASGQQRAGQALTF